MWGYILWVKCNDNDDDNKQGAFLILQVGCTDQESTAISIVVKGVHM